MTHTTKAEAGQVSLSAAEIYDRDFVPALFGQFAPHACRSCPDRCRRNGARRRLRHRYRGTGRGGRVGPRGRIAAVDINPGMLAVARAKSGRDRLERSPAEDLPFADDAFDVVLASSR